MLLTTASIVSSLIVAPDKDGDRKAIWNAHSQPTTPGGVGLWKETTDMLSKPFTQRMSVD